jgi:alkylation response protein AidB-like acyl-CoA dehydrogenase
MTLAIAPEFKLAESTTKSYLERAREIVPLLRAEAAAIETARELTPPIKAALTERNLFQVLLAPARGEMEITVADCMRVCETLALGDASTAWDVMAAMGGALVSAFLPAESANRVFAGPYDAVATAVGRVGKAVAAEGGYVVEARWPFLSGSPHATWIGGLCMVHDGDTPRMGPEGPHIIIPLLRKERVTMIDTWHATGLRGTGSHEAEVAGVFVPQDEAVDFTRGPRPGLPLIYSIDENVAAPLCASAVALGIAQSALDAFKELAIRRDHQSGGKAFEAPLPKLTVAECEAHLAQARAHVYSVSAEVDTGMAGGGLPGEDLVRAASLAATAAVEDAVEVVSKLYRAAGASAVFTGSVIERALRDIFTLAAHRMVQRENYMVHAPKLFV